MMMDLVAAGLDQLHERIAGRFARSEPRSRVREYVSGLVTGLERKNGWTLAEWAGEVSPDGMQRLLRRADWDVDGVRDDVRDYIVEQLGDPSGVLIADDTGFLKKGTRSAGVQRQYSGTAGRTKNCQVGVFLAYASPHGHALIDRELYLPQSWAEDPERCRAAGIPGDVEFVTKPQQAQAMIARAVAASVPFAWVTADEVYGQAKWLQAWLEGQDIWYVVAIRCSDTLTMAEGERRADALIGGVPARARQKISAGAVGLPEHDTGLIEIVEQLHQAAQAAGDQAFRSLLERASKELPVMASRSAVRMSAPREPGRQPSRTGRAATLQPRSPPMRPTRGRFG
jgi:SRSO17 transposase